MNLHEFLSKKAEPGDFLSIKHGAVKDHLYIKSLDSLEKDEALSFLLNKEIKSYVIKIDCKTCRKTISVKLKRSDKL